MNIQITYPDWTQKTENYEDILKKTKYTVLYFYPKDNTPGCSREAEDFHKYVADFAKLDCQVIGVSKDNYKSHCKFINKFELSFPLISDEDLALHKKFDVRKQKKFMWREYMGTIRTTFLLDYNDKIITIYPDVSVTNHAMQVLTNLQDMVNLSSL